MFDSPMQMLKLMAQTGQVMAEAQTVITLRMLGMVGLWPDSKYENSRMVTEKTAAVMASSRAAGRALAAGKMPAEVALAALKPVRARTKRNVTRLTK